MLYGERRIQPDRERWLRDVGPPKVAEYPDRPASEILSLASRSWREELTEISGQVRSFEYLASQVEVQAAFCSGCSPA